jgi:formylglycine-generating enzyme required for sulfatase activity
MTYSTTRCLLSLGFTLALSSLLVATFVVSASAVTIPTVPVGNAGNTPDYAAWLGPPYPIFGAVNYEYRVGTTEVTNAQYAEFLNAKAASDPLGLYNTHMDGSFGGITRSGSWGSYTYTTKTNMGNKPVNYVSWYDAIRFANWLNNGQGNGDTETGAYTLLGGTATPSNGNSITRNSGATWFMTSEDEWYKAAYYDPTLDGGAGGYWRFPTRSNSNPTIATANGLGDISNPGANVANYGNGAQILTTVGSAGPLSESYYGTSDQGENVREWNESLYFYGGAFLRGDRGGALYSLAEDMTGVALNWNDPALDDNAGAYGFRVATIVSEPGTAVLTMIGCMLMLCWSKRRKWPLTVLHSLPNGRRRLAKFVFVD